MAEVSMDVIEEISEGVDVQDPVPQSGKGVTPHVAPGGPKNFVCDVCPYRSKSSSLLNMHKICHTYQPGNKYKCKYCPYYVSVMRCLYQHMRLHPEHKEQTYATDDADIMVSIEEEKSGQPGEDRLDAQKTLIKDGKNCCNLCPFMCKSKNGLIYHRQFHRQKPSTPFKCPQCPYWVEQKQQIRMHERVHLPSYGVKPNSTSVSQAPVPHFASPAKSEMSDYYDGIEMAALKQQIINSKIRSCPLTPEKFTPFDENDREGKMEVDESENDDRFLIKGYVMDDNGQVLKTGLLRKLYSCSQCPYANVKVTNVKLHEVMHEERPPQEEGKEEVKEEGEEETREIVVIFKCEFCSYSTLKKKLRAQHIRVHSQQYEPGQDEIIDFEDPDAAVHSEANEVPEDDEDKEIVFKKPADAVKKPEPEEPMIKRPKTYGPRLDSGQVSTEFYVKYNEDSAEHILERVSVQKFNCDRCPYATLTRLNFERHVVLHGCRQGFTCEFCDYSVPSYQLLLQHKKLHLMPNPNLLSMQSLSNLTKLPEISADVAAAANFPMNKDDPISTEGVHDHLSLYENSEDFVEPKQMYRCDRCPFTSTRKDNLLAHLKFHMIRSALQCSYCDYSTSNQDLLTQHVKVHFTSDRQFESLSTHTPAVAENGTSDADDVDSKRNIQTKTDTKDPTTWNSQNIEGNSVDDVKVDKELESIDYAEFLTKNESENSSGSSGKKVSPGETEVKREESSCVCQYCDRKFQSSERTQKHEKQHLVGHKY